MNVVYQIRFRGRIAENIFREPFVIEEFEESEKELALRKWDRAFAHDSDFYEFLHLAEDAEAHQGKGVQEDRTKI